VPNIVDKAPTEAVILISGAGLGPLRGADEYSGSVAAGLVSRQDPAAASQVPPGSTVTYFVSKGPAPATVPDLVGDLEAAALADLSAAGLASGVRSEAYVDTMGAGQVISSTPAAGAQVPLGTPVDYIVSLGPAPVVSAPAATSAPIAIPDPTPEPTPAPQPAPIAVTVEVDDLSSQFIKRAGGWKQADSGYLLHSYWVPARAGKAKRIATWRPTLTAPGDYRIVVRIPSRDATTRKAVYRIKTVDGWVKHRLDQASTKGKWVDMGTFRLTTTPAVKLTDMTGERASLGRRVGFDAIRFVPVGQPRVSSDPASPADQRPADQRPADQPPADQPPADQPSVAPLPQVPQAGSEAPTVQPVVEPTSGDATPKPSHEPESAAAPTSEPTPDRTKEPTPAPTPEPTPDRTKEPAAEPTREPDPTPEPTPEPAVTPASEPDPTPALTPEPTADPISQPAAEASAEPDASPATG
jgi:hypothetical protein